MKEVGAGVLMLMGCGAIYLQIDPTTWSNALKLWSGRSIVRDHEIAFNPVPEVLRPQTLNRVPRLPDFPF
jgi:hypothetical protein